MNSLAESNGSADDAQRLFDLSRDLLSTTDRSGRFVKLNPAWERVLGWSREELRSRPAIDFMHPDDRARTLRLGHPADGGLPPDVTEFENRYRCKDGSYRWLQWNARLAGDVWYGVARDVTDTRRLGRQGVRDALTGLPNRVVLVDRMEHALARLERRAALVAVLFIDLDRLKLVNDGLGHETADRLLQAVAARLTATVRGVDTVSWLGGDEFVVLVDDAVRMWRTS